MFISETANLTTLLRLFTEGFRCFSLYEVEGDNSTGNEEMEVTCKPSPEHNILSINMPFCDCNLFDSVKLLEVEEAGLSDIAESRLDRELEDEVLL